MPLRMEFGSAGGSCHAAKAGATPAPIAVRGRPAARLYFGFFFLNFLVSKVSPGSDLSFW
jgi:hypothetical protein